MGGRKRGPRLKVFLSTFDKDGKDLDEITIGYDEYYEESQPVIDDDDYRVRRGIRRVKGKIYNYLGELQSEFENWYDETGERVRGRAVHQDGTVIED